MALPDAAYARLLALRNGLRHFERWSEQQARAADLTPAQHQLLLAIRGHGDRRGPTVGEVADYLLLRHHSVVGLVDRAEGAGLVTRDRDVSDHRVVRLRLTPTGAERLERLSTLHLAELERMATTLSVMSEGLGPVQEAHGFAPGAAARRRASTSSVAVGRIYDDPAPAGRVRVLVDRLWPRGVGKEDDRFDLWAKEVAPSPELRKWYDHVPERFEEFGERYRAELEEPPRSEALAELRQVAAGAGVLLLTATRDVKRSAAAVLEGVLAGS